MTRVKKPEPVFIEVIVPSWDTVFSVKNCKANSLLLLPQKFKLSNFSQGFRISTLLLTTSKKDC